MSTGQHDEKHESGIKKYNPSKAEWVEILTALLDEAKRGRLACLVFALKTPNGQHMVEHFGPVDVTEVACRAANERIATYAERHGRPEVAKAIREAMRNGGGVH